jgi:hypothetical protein
MGDTHSTAETEDYKAEAKKADETYRETEVYRR